VCPRGKSAVRVEDVGARAVQPVQIGMKEDARTTAQHWQAMANAGLRSVWDPWWQESLGVPAIDRGPRRVRASSAKPNFCTPKKSPVGVVLGSQRPCLEAD